MRKRLVVLLAILAIATPLAAQTTAQRPSREPDVIYVPTPQEVVDAMLKLAKVTSTDVVYDLGSGDGRIPITAAQKYGALQRGCEAILIWASRSAAAADWASSDSRPV